MLPRKDKYFAVTKPDGSFEIPNLAGGRGSGNPGLARTGRDLEWGDWCWTEKI